MNEKTRRQVLLLIALLVVLAGAIGFQLWGRGGSQAAAIPRSSWRPDGLPIATTKTLAAILHRRQTPVHVFE